MKQVKLAGNLKPLSFLWATIFWQQAVLQVSNEV